LYEFIEVNPVAGAPNTAVFLDGSKWKRSPGKFSQDDSWAAANLIRYEEFYSVETCKSRCLEYSETDTTTGQAKTCRAFWRAPATGFCSITTNAIEVAADESGSSGDVYELQTRSNCGLSDGHCEVDTAKRAKTFEYWKTSATYETILGLVNAEECAKRCTASKWGCKAFTYGRQGAQFRRCDLHDYNQYTEHKADTNYLDQYITSYSWTYEEGQEMDLSANPTLVASQDVDFYEYMRFKQEPVTTANVCTHRAEHSGDPTKVAICAHHRLQECRRDSNCVYNHMSFADGSEWYQQVSRRIDPSDSIVCPADRASSAVVTCSLAGDGQPYAAYQDRHPSIKGDVDENDPDHLKVEDFTGSADSYLACKDSCQAYTDPERTINPRTCKSIAHRAADGRCQLRSAAWSPDQVASLKVPTSSSDWTTSYVYGDKLKRQTTIKFTGAERDAGAAACAQRCYEDWHGCLSMDYSEASGTCILSSQSTAYPAIVMLDDAEYEHYDIRHHSQEPDPSPSICTHHPAYNTYHWQVALCKHHLGSGCKNEAEHCQYNKMTFADGSQWYEQPGQRLERKIQTGADAQETADFTANGDRDEDFIDDAEPRTGQDEAACARLCYDDPAGCTSFSFQVSTGTCVNHRVNRAGWAEAGQYAPAM
jgi:hypothetical protein